MAIWQVHIGSRNFWCSTMVTHGTRWCGTWPLRIRHGMLSSAQPGSTKSTRPICWLSRAKRSGLTYPSLTHRRLFIGFGSSVYPWFGSTWPGPARRLSIARAGCREVKLVHASHAPTKKNKTNKNEIETMFVCWGGGGGGVWACASSKFSDFCFNIFVIDFL